MTYELDPLKSYVRFYLAIRSQLLRVWSSVCAIEVALRDELGPFAADLAPVELPALATLVDSPREAPADLAALWAPEDETELEGLSDVYEVVGRFSFQGDGDGNLARITRLVAAGRSAAAENAEALRGLAALARTAADTAERMRGEEVQRATGARAERTAALEALAETVLLRAQQTQEALHAVPIPALDDASAAAEEYKKLRARLQQVYQTCLPFLKNAIAQVWAFVGDTVPQSFPDELPLVPELPPELVSVTAAGTEEVEKAERTLTALAEETQRLAATKHDIAGKLGKLDGEATGVSARRAEFAGDVDSARKLLDWARLGEQVTALKGRADEVESELRARVAQSGDQAAALARLVAQAEEEQKTLAEREAALGTMTTEHEELKKKEPLLFGKDDWRARVADGEAKVEAERAAVAQLAQAHAQRRVEVSAAEVRVGTAKTEQAIVERGLADVRTRRVEAEKAFSALAAELGAKRPTRQVPSSEVEEVVHALEHQLNEIDASLERLRAQQKRLKDDAIMVLAREKQIDVERQGAQSRVEGARIARAEGLEAALRRLATERKNAVDEHVREVLSALSKSLGQVGTVFIDPAREKLIRLTEPDFTAVERVKTAGEAARPVVERLVAERAPELTEVEKLLTQIEREFVDAAPAACRAAWG